VIKNENKVIENLPVSANKMKQISEMPEDMPVFLKGLCSPFHHIQCDLMRKGVENGVLAVDKVNRHIIIDLDKDQPEETATSLRNNL